MLLLLHKERITMVTMMMNAISLVMMMMMMKHYNGHTNGMSSKMVMYFSSIRSHMIIYYVFLTEYRRGEGNRKNMG